jgi:hypothetical protein
VILDLKAIWGLWGTLFRVFKPALFWRMVSHFAVGGVVVFLDCWFSDYRSFVHLDFLDASILMDDHVDASGRLDGGNSEGDCVSNGGKIEVRCSAV